MALALVAPLALRADDSAPASSGTAAASADSSSPTASAAPTAVAKNDAPGSIKPGNDLIDAGKYDEALAYFQGIGEQSDSNGHSKREPWRLVGLSRAENGLGQFDKSGDFAQQAITIDGTNGVAWNLLGSAEANQGKRGDAIATYKKGIDALKAAGKDTSKLEANLAPLQQAQDDADKKAGKTPSNDTTTASAASSASASSGTASASSGTAQ
jgi:tetratricopeptide (TPR) repeat protein